MDTMEMDPQTRAARTWDGQQANVAAPSAFLQRLSVVAQEGVLIGVKWMIALILMLWAVSWSLGDYNIVRQRALSGQQAFDFIQQQLAAQKAAAAKGPQP